MRKEALFDIFYECRFPDEDVIDDKGFRPIITSEDVAAHYTDGSKTMGTL